jgi:hypothetical protein
LERKEMAPEKRVDGSRGRPEEEERAEPDEEAFEARMEVLMLTMGIRTLRE